MLHLVQLDRSYQSRDHLRHDGCVRRVCQSVSKRMNGSDDVKKTLALIILRHVDRGECNAEQLAEIAFREWAGTDRSAIGDRWATG